MPRLEDVRCLDPERRAAVREHPVLNGIDFVEYFEDREALPPLYCLVVTFLKTSGLSELVGHLENFEIMGGTRIVGIGVIDVQPEDEPNQLKVLLDGSGDFSLYTIRIVSSEAVDTGFMDGRLSSAQFSFKSDCPTGFDCLLEEECPAEPLSEPLLDYLAKDYASFQRLMLDLIPQRNPGWLERNPADLGMALVDLLAYAGDHLSYYQDAVATEVFLDTCRQRISARRHSRLIDYRTHDGRNAWSFSQFDVDSTGFVPAGTPLLTRIFRPLQGESSLPGVEVDAGNLDDLLSDSALSDVTVFETSVGLTVDPRNNRLYLHSWSDRECCLPKGATGVTIYGVDKATGTASQPPLQPGDYLLLEEARGPATGLEADADPEHRQVVRLEAVEEQTDPVYRNQLVSATDSAGTQVWKLQPISDPSQDPLTVLKVTWGERDRLSFPMCVSSRDDKGREVTQASLAHGNVVPCDHGRRVEEELPTPKSLASEGLRDVEFTSGPLTFQAMPVADKGDESDPKAAFGDDGAPIDRHRLDALTREARPAAALRIDFPAGESEIWTPVPDLLESRPFHRHFVVEVDNRGRAALRFGDDQYGRNPIEALRVQAIYRIGNGLEGNLGRESLVHVVHDPAVPNWPDIRGVFQPVTAAGGVEPETIEQVRQTAPRAFHAEQFRAVTEADYEAAALKLEEVAAANANFRWTGSWFTVFVAVHPSDPAQVMVEAGGRAALTPEFESAVKAHLTRYKLAGYDLRVPAARYVPLEISIRICVATGHFRGAVTEDVLRSLSSRRFADGSVGFFHPSRFAFGQAVYISRLYKTIEDVPGVESAVVEVFKRYWEVENRELENGLIPVGSSEIARLDNDPNFRENGVLEVSAVGGL